MAGFEDLARDVGQYWAAGGMGAIQGQQDVTNKVNAFRQLAPLQLEQQRQMDELQAQQRRKDLQTEYEMSQGMWDRFLGAQPTQGQQYPPMAIGPAPQPAGPIPSAFHQEGIQPVGFSPEFEQTAPDLTGMLQGAQPRVQPSGIPRGGGLPAGVSMPIGVGRFKGTVTGRDPERLDHARAVAASAGLDHIFSPAEGQAFLKSEEQQALKLRQPAGPHYFSQAGTGSQYVVRQPGAQPELVLSGDKPEPSLANIPDNIVYDVAGGGPSVRLQDGSLLDKPRAESIIKQKAAMQGLTGAERGKGFGLWRTVQMLDTQQGNRPVTITVGQLTENPERYVSAGAGVPALNKATLLEDIRGAIGRTRTALQGMPEFSPTQASQIAIIMGSGDPGMFRSFFQTGVGQTLTPEQQDYLIQLFQLRENAMAMRSVLGAGQGSDELRAAILRTVPGAATPSKQYAAKQLDAFEQTLDRLSRGIPNVPLRPMPGETGRQPESSGNYAGIPSPPNPQSPRNIKYKGQLMYWDGKAYGPAR